jgi:hypothetical protein
VDLKKKSVTVGVPQNGIRHTTYGLDDTIPLSLFGVTVEAGVNDLFGAE